MEGLDLANQDQGIKISTCILLNMYAFMFKNVLVLVVNCELLICIDPK